MSLGWGLHENPGATKDRVSRRVCSRRTVGHQSPTRHLDIKCVSMRPTPSRCRSRMTPLTEATEIGTSDEKQRSENDIPIPATAPTLPLSLQAPSVYTTIVSHSPSSAGRVLVVTLFAGLDDVDGSDVAPNRLMFPHFPWTLIAFAPVPGVFHGSSRSTLCESATHDAGFRLTRRARSPSGRTWTTTRADSIKS